ncbi:NADH:ubiquinone oxidoreductase 22 kDa subunit [Haematococcus lacustris]|uniref:NADH:ubiquinone oxidoreductase 22 kDa subunit n=2 Tax=Haematococcus lacustris TaxID=44745 RepID=A0A699ZQD5_HAELA|nr:NADH:ubiquinone oxidoreductase 22 kDa subunit [Haematococcus lacustris]
MLRSLLNPFRALVAGQGSRILQPCSSLRGYAGHHDDDHERHEVKGIIGSPLNEVLIEAGPISSPTWVSTPSTLWTRTCSSLETTGAASRHQCSKGQRHAWTQERPASTSNKRSSWSCFEIAVHGSYMCLLPLHVTLLAMLPCSWDWDQVAPLHLCASFCGCRQHIPNYKPDSASGDAIQRTFRDIVQENVRDSSFLASYVPVTPALNKMTIGFGAIKPWILHTEWAFSGLHDDPTTQFEERTVEIHS